MRRNHRRHDPHHADAQCQHPYSQLVTHRHVPLHPVFNGILSFIRCGKVKQRAGGWRFCAPVLPVWMLNAALPLGSTNAVQRLLMVEGANHIHLVTIDAYPPEQKVTRGKPD
jgi:hypothetical protein